MPGARVSVVVPTHDRHRLLALTLRSVLRQEEVDFDVTVVDDGSTDDTASFLARVRDPRVRVIRNERPAGVAAARSQGLDATTGRWVAFVDDDDLWAPTKLTMQLAASRETGRRWVYAGVVEIDAAGRLIGGTPPPSPERVSRRLRRMNLIPGGSSGVLMARGAIDQAGGWDPTVFHADWDLWIRLLAAGPPACAPAPLVAYRVHGGQSSVDIQRVVEGIRVITRRYGGRPDRAAIHHYLAFLHHRAGRNARAAGHFALAAALGEPVAVARNVSTIVRARAGRRFPALTPREDPHAAWMTEAERWLSALA
jgi:GT2 family glycosyltransferase